MSSMKRLAVMAAFSHFNGHENHNNSTMMLPWTFTTTTTTTKTQTEVAISSFAANSAYNQNNISSSPQIGGLGLLHQQNLRSGTINGAGSGSSYGGGVGAFGGYSAGSWSGGAPVMGGSGSSSSSGGSSDGSNHINGNVNVLLGGAMLSVVTTVLCVVCYCCHRNIKKRTEAAYRQRWMENDTNMEIYSVEQCYETSGLFLDSSEGLAVPTLSHEPPPSYDAVMVAMQETNHQPSRISPPPDYRSMNDVSGSSGNVIENPKFITNGGNGNSLRIKKVLSAQSCCSLQRAEAENLFQLGVVAAAAAAATSGRFGASALGRKSLPYAAHNLAEGRFVNHQHPYYQGCPLCGKFRYDDSMSLSSDSGLDQVVVTTVDVNNGNTPPQVGGGGGDTDTCYCTPMQSPTIVEDSNNNSGTIAYEIIDDRRRISSTEQLMISSSSHAKYENTINNNDSLVDGTPTTGGGGGGDGAVTSTTLSPSLSSEPTSSQQVATTTITAVETAASTSDNNRDIANNITDDVMLDLDSINDNGIIRLDMSKIIDKTGLPTYEAALKLESSGYV
ncbi:uncharacterized protein LOC129907475 [Episyrphus balteatus]|uniref:uncharacterized protein LOC129907475 n=1 Tax=Episyrphus balteatus TaxID=286459 RepID=UPI002485BE4D|nr:uncharacterized protein LOC129907475 [Episyrphus balteatus]